MSQAERVSISERFEELETVGSGGEVSKPLTDSYELTSRYSADGSHLIRLGPIDQTQEEPPNTVSLVARARCDQEGNLAGLDRKQIERDRDQFSVLRVWVTIESERQLLVYYDMDPADPSRGIISNITLRKGPLDRRTGQPTRREDWPELASLARLPEIIDIRASVERIVFGQDAQGNPLTDEALEAQLLVPAPTVMGGATWGLATDPAAE